MFPSILTTYYYLMLEIKLMSQKELFRPCLDSTLNALVELSSFFGQHRDAGVVCVQ